MAEEQQIQDIPYRKKVYDLLASKFSDFNRSEQDFYKLLDSDPAYKDKVYDLLSSKFNDFKRSKEEFSSMIAPVKKKDSPVSSLGSSVGQDLSRPTGPVVPEAKPWEASLKPSTSKSTSQSDVEKLYQRINSFDAEKSDIWNAYHKDPVAFRAWTDKTFAGDNRYNPEAIKAEPYFAGIKDEKRRDELVKDAYVDRVAGIYDSKKNDAILEQARALRQDIGAKAHEAFDKIVASGAGEYKTFPTTTEEIKKIVLDNQKAKALLSNGGPAKITGDNRIKLEAFYKASSEALPYLQQIAGSMAFDQITKEGRTPTALEIGQRVMEATDPQRYARYKEVRGDKSYMGGDTPVKADAVNRDMVEIGANTLMTYGNKSSIEAARLYKRSLKNTFTYGEQEKVKNKIASYMWTHGGSSLFNIGWNPATWDKNINNDNNKAARLFKEALATLSPEELGYWNQAKASNNTRLPWSGMSKSFGENYLNTLKDAGTTVLGVLGLIPDQDRERALSNLDDMTSSTTVGENPQEVSRYEYLKGLVKSGKADPAEVQEFNSLSERVHVRSYGQKVKDMVGAGTGQFVGLGTISAFTGGLSNANSFGGAVRALISVAGSEGSVGAAAWLMSNEQNQKQAMLLHPGNEGKQFITANIFNAVDMLTERLFPEEQFLSPKFKKGIATELRGLSLNTLDRAINEGVIKRAAKKIYSMSKELVKVPGQEVSEEVIGMVLKDGIYNSIVRPEFGDDGVTLQKTLDTVEQAAFGSLALGLPHAIMAGRGQHRIVNTLWDNSISVDTYIKNRESLDKMVANGEVTKEEADDIIRVMSRGRQEVLSNPALNGNQLTENQKKNYLARLVSEGMAQSNLAKETDDAVREKIRKDIEASKNVRVKMLNGDIQVDSEQRERNINRLKVGITNAVTQAQVADLKGKVDEDEYNRLKLIADRLDNARALEQAGNFDEANRLYDSILDDAENDLSSMFDDMPDVNVRIERSKGNFFSDPEPTFDYTVEDAGDNTPEIARRLASLANNRFHQEAVHISRVDSDPAGGNFGEEQEDRSVYEPNLNITFDEPLTDQQMAELEKNIQDAGLAGSTRISGNKGVVLYNISNYKNHGEFIEQTDKALDWLFRQGVRFQVERGARKIWNIGKSSGPGFVSYEEAANLPSFVPQKQSAKERLRQTFFGKLNDAVAKAGKALKSTNIKIKVIDSQQEYDALVSADGNQNNRGTEGVFVSKDGTILLNAERIAEAEDAGLVVWHETSHPIVNIIRNTNPGLYRSVVNGLKQAAETNMAVADAKDWAENEYGDGGELSVEDEFLVETIARVAAGHIDLSTLKPSLRQRMIDVVNSFAKALGLGQVLNDTDLAAFKKLAGQVSDVLNGGKDISSIVGKENVGNYQYNEDQLRKKSSEVAKATEDKTVEGKHHDSMVLVGKENKQDVVLYSGPVSLESVKQSKPAMYVSRAQDLAETHLVQGKVKPLNPEASVEAKMRWADNVFAKAKETVVSNLLFIYNNIPQHIRDISKLWYDGANIIAQEAAKKYGVTLEQAAAVIASQSPQKPWYDNVHLAHFMLDYNHNNQNKEFSQEIFDYYKENSDGYEEQVAYLPELEKLIGKKYSDLSDYDRSIMIRADFDNHYDRRAPLRVPTGDVVGRVSSMSSFSGYNTVAKGVSILRDGSDENISANLGKASKVRNFNNNIVNPKMDGEVTIDTHAIAVGYMLPLGSKSPEVKFDPATYAFFADAYREAARQSGVLAREMQSIVWEGARALFPATDKKSSSKDAARTVWAEYKKKSLTLSEAQEKIKANGKDLAITDWSKFTDKILDGEGKASYLTELSLAGGDQSTAGSRAGSRTDSRVSSVGKRNSKSQQASKGNRLAPNGKPSNLNEKQYDQVRTPEFKNWFGDWEKDPENASKVVDENGEPLVVYHGSPNKFDVFNRQRSRSGLREFGHFFSTNIELAKIYGENILPVFLNLKDVKRFDAKMGANIEAWRNLKVDAGYKIASNRDALQFIKDGDYGVQKADGVAAENIADLFLGFNPSQEDIDKFLGTTYLVFDGNENMIKSAVDNSGQFSTTDNRIQASRGNRNFGRDAKLAQFVLQEKAAGTSIEEIKDAILSMYPKLKDVDTLIADPEAYLNQKPQPTKASAVKINKTVKSVDTETKSQLSEIKRRLKEWARGYKTGYKDGSTAGFYEGADKGMDAGYKTGMQDATDIAKENARIEKQMRDTITDRINNIINKAKANGSLTADISAKVLAAAVRRLANAKTPGAMLKFVDYLNELAKDIHYESKLQAGNDLRSQIKKALKSKDKNASTKAIVREFARIDPSSVEDIDEYNELAARVLTNAKTVTVTSNGYRNESYATSNTEIQDYLDRHAEHAEQQMRDRLADQYDDLVQAGVIDPSTMTADEMQEIIDAVNGDPENLDQLVAEKWARKEAKEEALRKLVDYQRMSLDGLQMITTAEQERVLRNIKNLDLSKLNAKQLAKLNDDINNIVVNGDFTGTGEISILAEVQANTRELKDKVKSSGINLTDLKNVLIKGFASIAMINEFIFKSTKLASEAQRLSGISDIHNGYARAKKLQEQVIEDYIQRKSRMKDADSLINRYTRGVLADVMNNFGGTEQEIKAEFERRKNWIRVTYERLLASEVKEEQQEGEVIRQVYNNILEGSENIIDVMDKAGEDNRALVRFWRREFADRMDAMKENAEIYNNKVFEQVDNYTPTSLKGFNNNQFMPASTQRDMFDAAFVNNRLTAREAGSKSKKSRMPEPPPTGVLNLDFDSVQSKRFYESNFDIETSAAIAKAKAFLTSEEAGEVFGGTGNVRTITEAVKSSLDLQRGTSVPAKMLDRVVKKAVGVLSAKGIRMALAGLTQLPKQYLSVMVSTLGNLGADAHLYVKALTVSNKIKLFDKYLIGLRGDTQGGFNKEVDYAQIDRAEFGNAVKKSLVAVDNLSRKLADVAMLALTKSDVSVARTSWLAYYMQSLQQQGVDLSTIDWEKEHENANEQAAAYAEQQVSRTQNFNDASVGGEFVKEKNSGLSALKNIFLPFSSFAINQRVRMTNDMQKILFGGKKGEAVRSLAATTAEVAAFNALKIYLIAKAYGVGAHGLMSMAGLFDDDDDTVMKKFQQMEADREERMKSVTINGTHMSSDTKKFAAATANDFFFGGLGGFTQNMLQRGVNKVYGSMVKELNGKGEEVKDPKLFFVKEDAEWWEGMGALSIMPGKAISMFAMLDKAARGTDYYKSKTDVRKIELTDSEKKAAMISGAIDAMSIMGVPLAGDADLNYTNDRMKAYLKRRMDYKYGHKQEIIVPAKDKTDVDRRTGRK